MSAISVAERLHQPMEHTVDAHPTEQSFRVLQAIERVRKIPRDRRTPKPVSFQLKEVPAGQGHVNWYIGLRDAVDDQSDEALALRDALSDYIAMLQSEQDRVDAAAEMERKARLLAEGHPSSDGLGPSDLGRWTVTHMKTYNEVGYAPWYVDFHDGVFKWRRIDKNAGEYGLFISQFFAERIAKRIARGAAAVARKDWAEHMQSEAERLRDGP